MDPFSFLVGCVTGVSGVAILFMIFQIIRPWVRLKTHGGKGSLVDLLFMRVRRNPVSLLVEAYIRLLHLGVPTTLREVESHYVGNQTHITTTAELVESFLEGLDRRWQS